MKNKLFRCILAFVICFVLIGNTVISALALEVPDLNRKGSVTVRMHYENTSVSGGKLTLYRVARVDDTDQNYTFQLTGGFIEYTGYITDFDSTDSIESMEKYIEANNITGITASIDRDGKAVFDNLEIGLYFVIQSEAASGYYPAQSFFVSFPVKEGDSYIYDVNATPKTSLEKLPPPSPQIPDTGVDQWKVPLIAVSGVLVFIAGWLLYRKETANG